MTEENQGIVAEAEVPELPAPDQETTASPETETREPAAEEAPKTFTQEELDAIVAKRTAQAERRLRRELEQRAPEPAYEAQVDDDAPTPTREQIIAEYKAQEQAQALDAQYAERAEAAIEKYDDFEQVAYNPTLPITPDMGLAIKASDIGPDVLYWLGSNPNEARRIAMLPDQVLRAREIGKIEAQLGANPPAKRTSSAPAPIAPVTAHNRAQPVYDTTDPRSTKTMSTSEWIAAEEKRMRREWEARNK